MYRIEPASFSATLQHTLQKTQERLEKYLDSPNEDNVHDVRTSIRRLEAVCKIMPKKLREKPKIKDFVVAYRDLFRINSQIRDFDIMSKKISSNNAVLELIEKKKRKKIVQARRQAKYANSLKFPLITTDDIEASKLEKRFNKITYRLLERIQTLIPKVIEKEKNVLELHELRKDCKKLRYLFEIISDASSVDFVNHLKRIQDSLGSIHDVDITVDFLQRLPRKYKVDAIIKSECNLRSLLYQKFVQEYKDFKT